MSKPGSHLHFAILEQLTTSGPEAAFAGTGGAGTGGTVVDAPADMSTTETATATETAMETAGETAVNICANNYPNAATK